MDTKHDTAQTLKVVAMILIFAGILLIAYGGYAYATENGNVSDRLPGGSVTFGERDIPFTIIGGVVGIAIGMALLFVKRPTVTGIPRTPTMPRT
jgi:TRAP-type C4-dicarboxylate transport system permease small subunit